VKVLSFVATYIKWRAKRSLLGSVIATFQFKKIGLICRLYIIGVFFFMESWTKLSFNF